MGETPHTASHEEAKNFVRYFQTMMAEEARIQGIKGITSNWEHTGTASEKLVRMTVLIPYTKD